MSVERQRRRRAAAAWAAAAALWLVIWAHGARTHGLTQENEQQLWLGITWMDSAKLLVLPFGLLAVAVWMVGRVVRPARRLHRTAWLLALAVVAVQVVAVAGQFWPFPWGSYETSFADLGGQSAGWTRFSGPVQALASLLLAVLMVPVGAGLARAGVVPFWAVVPLVLGMLATFFLTPPSWLPAVAWLLVAWGVLKVPRRVRGG